MRKILLVSLLVAANLGFAFSADQQCDLTKTNNPKTCSCIMNNSVTGCQKIFGVNSPFCKSSTMASLFKGDPNLAITKCEQQSQYPKECAPSINYYNNYCQNKGFTA